MKPIVACLCLLALAILPACAGSTREPLPHGQKDIIPITDLKQIAGKWEGAMTPDPQPLNATEDWLRVTIGEDGSYDFTSFPEVELFKGKGKLTLHEGQAVDRSEQGSVAFALADRKGRQVLRAVGLARDGIQYSAELGQKK